MSTHKTPTYSFLLKSIFLASLLGVLGNSSHAATLVGYWRFENSGTLGLDSSSNGLNLTNTNSVSSSSTVFPNPVPQTGASNTLNANLALASSQYLSVADAAPFAFQNFTIEAYVQVDSFGNSTTPRIVASQGDTSTSNFSWQLGISGNGSSAGSDTLFLQISKGGGSVITITSGLSLTALSDYYIAAATTFTPGVGSSTTFYLQNITSSGALQNSVATSSTDAIFNSTANFAIGADFNNGAASRFFDGKIDEVRLTNGALPESALLNVVPEPSITAFMVSGLIVVALIGFARHRRQATHELTFSQSGALE